MHAPTPAPPPEGERIAEEDSVARDTTPAPPAPLSTRPSLVRVPPTMSEVRLAPELAGAVPGASLPIGPPRRAPLLPPPRPVRAASGTTILPPPKASTMRPGAPIRVSIRTSLRDPDLFVVRALPEGIEAPSGTREGMLVLSSAHVVSGGRDAAFDGDGADDGEEVTEETFDDTDEVLGLVEGTR